MIITRIRNTFIGIALFILLVFLFSLLFENQFVVSKSVSIKAPVDSVFPYINSPEKWNQWMSWQLPDTNYKYIFSGPAAGENSAIVMKGPLVDITFKITSSQINKAIRYEITTADGEFRTDGDIVVKPVGNTTQVIWVDSGDVGYNSFARFSLKSVTERQGADMQVSLQKLKKVAEGKGE
jgi:uncharacterized protein YndB with AHSA1/START domain